MCCLGCQSVAEAIVAGGHGEYYRQRDAMPESPREALPVAFRELGLFDHPEAQKGFVRPVGEHEREASLILEGITCAACVWLNESHLARQAGVTAVNINYATRRARVRWDERKTKLSEILAAVAAIGYRAHPYDPARSESLAQEERRGALWRVFVAGFGMMQVMMYAIPVYLADDGTMAADIELLMRWASLILTLPVVLYSAAPFFRSAWRDLSLCRVGMDVPVALGIGCAFVASFWATLEGTGEVYFDSVTMFVFLLLGGRYLEMMARQRAVRGVEALAKAMPTFAQRLVAFPALETDVVVASSLMVGDLILVKPGEGIPADGVVVQGQSEADEALLTGESIPVRKDVGGSVVGGSVNVGSPLVVRVTGVGEQTRIAAIQRLMEQAATEKPRLALLADRVAARFVAALLLLALITAVSWYVIEPQRALWVFVSVLVVSCPCALSLATPAALTVATGAMAARGLLIARGHAIETLAQADCWVFDKTGTLTCGKPRLVEIFTADGESSVQVHRLAAALEMGSEHPLALALREGVSTEGIGDLGHLRSVTGAGVEAMAAGERLRLGSPGFALPASLAELPSFAAQWQAEGDTLIVLADERRWRALFRVRDVVRLSAAPAILGLQALGLETALMSGDSLPTALKAGERLGIRRTWGALSPEDKYCRLRELQEHGHVVAMVGDGVNDAPVLAQAQVSIAMGSGTELARTQSDMVLLGENLQQLVSGVRIARKTMSIIRQNLAWAFAYNLLAIPAAMAGLITPWMAGIGMSASSLLVVLNALRLTRPSHVT
jgi:Cu2+-exporting ATPase